MGELRRDNEMKNYAKLHIHQYLNLRGGKNLKFKLLPHLLETGGKILLLNKLVFNPTMLMQEIFKVM